MKKVFVGAVATVLEGNLEGIKGIVIYANSKTNTVKLLLMNNRDLIITSFDNIRQGA